MTSKNLFINLIKEDTKRRLWTAALSSLVFFFTFPVWAALLASDYLNPSTINIEWGDAALRMEHMKKELMERFLEWGSIENGLLVFIMILFAVVCAVSGFSYLHSKKKTDFFHSIPIKREKLFAAAYINGILYVAIPYFIGLVLAALFIQTKASTPMEWGTVFAAYAVHMAFYLLVYSTVIVAVMLTGHTLVSLMGTLVFFVWGPGLSVLILGYFATYFDTFYTNQTFLVSFTTYSSPVSWYISFISNYSGFTARIFLVLVAVAVLTALSVFLYKKRPSEAAGRAMAFKRSQPIIKFLIVVPIALYSSLFFHQIRGGDGWGIFGLFCGTAISYCIVEIIYNFDFRRLFAHKKHLVVCTLASAAILAFFRFDVIGYDTYIPSADKVESSGFYSRNMDSETVNDYLLKPVLKQNRSGVHAAEFSFDNNENVLLRDMRLLNTEDVLTIAEQGIEDVKAGSMRNSDLRYNSAEPQVNREYVIIEYHLKNGSNVVRSYFMDVSTVESSIDTIYSQKEYKEAVYPVLKQDVEDIAGINYQEFRDFRQVKFSDTEMKERILTSYQEELSALTTSTRRKESPIATIQFKTNEMQEMIDILRKEGTYYTIFNQYHYYPIYPSFTKTIALLKECSIEVGTFLTAEKVEKIEVIRSVREDAIVLPEAEYEEEFAPSTTDMSRVNEKLTIVTDKKEIEEILNVAISNELPVSNNLYERNADVRMTAFVLQNILEVPSSEFTDIYQDRSDGSSAEYNSYSLSLPKDLIPEFIR